MLPRDGLPPEKGHETRSVVRELTPKRVWFAEALIAATAAEVQRLIAKAKEWAGSLGKPVVLWIADKQDAFVTGIRAAFPGVPHGYGDNPLLGDGAQPVLEADRHAKVPMRRQVRGLRTIDQAVLRPQGAAAEDHAGATEPETTATAPVTTQPASSDPRPVDSACDVVLDYCAAVRGILNDDPGGPRHPPGVWMAAAWDEVRDSIHRTWDEKQGGSLRSNWAAWPTASTAAGTRSEPSKRRSESTARRSRRLPRP
jgi:hypothetical protein